MKKTLWNLLNAILTHSGLSNGTKEWLSNGTNTKSIARDAAQFGRSQHDKQTTFLHR
jgi:hypothetical protein